MEAIASNITRTLVADRDRMKILPRYAGRLGVMLEATIYQVLGELNKEYEGAHWNFYQLDNNAFYMAPTGLAEPLLVTCAGNWYSGTMSADAAGLTATLIAVNRMAWGTGGADRNRFVHLFYRLRDFAIDHDEGAQILHAID